MQLGQIKLEEFSAFGGAAVAARPAGTVEQHGARTRAGSGSWPLPAAATTHNVRGAHGEQPHARTQ